jgi:serpin B
MYAMRGTHRHRARSVAASLAIGSMTVLTGCGTAQTPLEPLESLPRELSPVEQALIDSGNGFGLSLFGELGGAREGKNVIVSPLSAYMALGMTANGADGTTLDAMRTTLGHGGLDEEEANDAYRTLIELLRGLDGDVDFGIANSIWHRDDFPTSPAFVDASREYFDALVSALDFADPGATATINGWVEENTNGKITELIQEITPQDVMFLINAIYFKGAWQSPFDPDLTREAAFDLTDGTTVQARLMSRQDDFLYQENELFQGVDLRYGRGAFSMTVLLPAAGRALDDLLPQLDEARWDGWMTGFSTQRILLELPRFTLEWEKKLNDALSALGMGIAFDRGNANFGRLAESGAPLPGNLFITEVKQKTFIDVNEEGTEAAAATSVGVGVTSIPPTMRVDRPFLFAIRERFSGTILFLGLVENPLGGE